MSVAIGSAPFAVSAARLLVRLSRFCVVVLGAVPVGSGQPSGQLQQQLQELKQQYAETTCMLEQRIAALEQQSKKRKW